MAKKVNYRLENYNGGLSVLPTPQERGELILTEQLGYELRFERTKQFVKGGLTKVKFEPEPTGDRSCRVTMRLLDREGGVGTFDLPDTAAHELAAEVERRTNEGEAIAARQARIQAPGEWWLIPGAFRELGPTEVLSVKDCRYLGGWSGHPEAHGATNVLNIGKGGLEYRGMKTIFTIPWSEVAGIEIDGPEHVSQRVTFSRALSLGVFDSKTAVICVQTRSDEEARFQTDQWTAPELRAKLTPVLSQVLRPAGAKQAPTPPPPEVALPPVPRSSIADELAKLAKLRSDGILTDDEFAAQKAKLLG